MNELSKRTVGLHVYMFKGHSLTQILLPRLFLVVCFPLRLPCLWFVECKVSNPVHNFQNCRWFPRNAVLHEGYSLMSYFIFVSQDVPVVMIMTAFSAGTLPLEANCTECNCVLSPMYLRMPVNQLGTKMPLNSIMAWRPCWDPTLQKLIEWCGGGRTVGILVVTWGICLWSLFWALLARLLAPVLFLTCGVWRV